VKTEVLLMQLTHRHTVVPTSVLVAGVLLALFLAFPWALMACRAIGLPGWMYGAEPLAGWLRVWALTPAALLLGAFIALVWAMRKERSIP
jgi:hypothetical protein